MQVQREDGHSTSRCFDASQVINDGRLSEFSGLKTFINDLLSNFKITQIGYNTAQN
jgi:hypothetical protein